jgi:hypothetical protein
VQRQRTDVTVVRVVAYKRKGAGRDREEDGAHFLDGQFLEVKVAVPHYIAGKEADKNFTAVKCWDDEDNFRPRVLWTRPKTERMNVDTFTLSEVKATVIMCVLNMEFCQLSMILFCI